MADIFNATVLCDNCNIKTKKLIIEKDGIRLRALRCPKCDKTYFHPEDKQRLDQFSKIKNKSFQVKLRMVGNSYTISIPREIISYQDDLQKKLNKMLFLTLEEPEKLSIFFRRKVLRD